jgi:hypothetical protein
LFSPVNARAQSAPQVFQPAPLAPDTFDWIQLTSDEWLKGELIALYDGRLEFDSEELENLTFDWDDIRELRTGRVVQVRFKNRTQLTGRLLVDAKTVRVLGDTEQQFDRAELDYSGGTQGIQLLVRQRQTSDSPSDAAIPIRLRPTPSRVLSAAR